MRFRLRVFFFPCFFVLFACGVRSWQGCEDDTMCPCRSVPAPLPHSSASALSLARRAALFRRRAYLYHASSARAWLASTTYAGRPLRGVPQRVSSPWKGGHFLEIFLETQTCLGERQQQKEEATPLEQRVRAKSPPGPSQSSDRHSYT